MPIVIDVKKDPFYKEGYKVGMREGKRAGKEEGFYEGLIVEAQEALLDLLTERFGNLSEELQAKIKGIRDKELLRKLRILVLRAQDWQEVERELFKIS